MGVLNTKQRYSLFITFTFALTNQPIIDMNIIETERPEVDTPAVEEPNNGTPPSLDLTPEQRKSIDDRKAELLQNSSERLSTISATGKIDLTENQGKPDINYEEKYNEFLSDPILSKLYETKLAGANLEELFKAVPASAPIDVSKIDRVTLYTQSLQGKNYSSDEVELLVDKFKKKDFEAQETMVASLREELKKSTTSQSPEILKLIDNANQVMAPIKKREDETYSNYVSSIENTVKSMKGDDGKEIPKEKAKELVETAKLLSVINRPKKRDGTLVGVSAEDIKNVIQKAQRLVYYDQHMQAAYALGIDVALDPRVRANADLNTGSKPIIKVEKQKEHIM